MKCALYRVDTGQPFIEDAMMQTNTDGSVSFALPNGAGWAGQEPMVYGLRHPDQPASESPGAYQRFNPPVGLSVTIVTRPQDPPFGYYFIQGRSF